MNYVQFHIGDWELGTRLLSPIEKGIYIDLLMLYYSTERPIVRSYFERITKAYTDDERRAFDFVISEFFEEKEDGFHQRRCDEEIAAFHAKSEKARKSVLSRWNKARQAEEPNESAKKTANERNTNVSTDEIRTYNERSTDEILTNNQEPITNKYKETEKENATAPSARTAFPSRVPAIQKPDGVEPEDWQAYLKLRKQKRLPLTQRALDSMLAEAEKADLSPQQMIVCCLERSWASFRADWYEKEQAEKPLDIDEYIRKNAASFDDYVPPEHQGAVR